MAKRISELDVATSVSDSDYIPCVQGGVTKRATRAALYPDDVPVDTSSRILDLTGDRAPAIPDDPAGVTYFQDAWATTDSFAGYNSTLSVSGGILKITATGTPHSAFRSIPSVTGKLFIIRVKSSRTGPVSLIATVGGTPNITITTKIVVAGVWTDISGYVSGASTVIGFLQPSVAIGDTLEISFIYLGTGAYLSKLIDRAGVPWTNYGALPVDGPFGNGLQFNGAQYLLAPGPMTGIVGTFAIKFLLSDVSGTQMIANNRDSTGKNGLGLAYSSGLLVASGGGSVAPATNCGALSAGVINEIIFTWIGTTLEYTLNGGVKQTITLSEAVSPGGVALSLMSSTATGLPTTFARGTIYALRADSRVWTDEEIARWSRDPYSEDSGLVDAFSLDFTNLPTFADNAAAIAGNLPAGKLYKTSTGNVLVRY